MKHGQLVTTDLEEGRPSGDVLQRTCVDTASPLSLSNPQLSVTHHRSGGERVGVAATGAITGLRGGAAGGGQVVRMQGGQAVGELGMDKRWRE